MSRPWLDLSPPHSRMIRTRPRCAKYAVAQAEIHAQLADPVEEFDVAEQPGLQPDHALSDLTPGRQIPEPIKPLAKHVGLTDLEHV